MTTLDISKNKCTHLTILERNEGIAKDFASDTTFPILRLLFFRRPLSGAFPIILHSIQLFNPFFSVCLSPFLPVTFLFAFIISTIYHCTQSISHHYFIHPSSQPARSQNTG